MDSRSLAAANAALLECYDAHHERLYRYAFRLLRSQQLTEEAVQESWAKCLQRRQEFLSLPPQERLPWLTVVVRNTALDLLRQEGRYRSLAPDWDTAAPPAAEVGDIVAIIRAMPARYREILELKFVCEWSDEAIARQLALPVSTVTSRLQRGRRLLQAALQKEGYHP